MGIADGGLRGDLKKWLPKPDWHWTPIETRGTVNGVPDTFFCERRAGVSGWIECKKTDGWAIKFESHQIRWLSVHADAGVRCFVAVRGQGVGSSEGYGDSLWLLRGSAASDLDERGLQWFQDQRDHRLLGVWCGSPKQWDWHAIRMELIRADGPEWSTRT